MAKFLLRRIGVVDDWSGTRPSLQDCIEVVLAQSDTLMDAVLEGLAASSVKPKGKVSYGELSLVSKMATDYLCGQSSAVKKTFLSLLRQGVYNSGSQNLEEQPLVRFDDLQLFDTKQIDASIEYALAQQEVSRCVAEVLPALNGLISSLLGWITVQPHLNPLKPEVFVRALRGCLAQHAQDEKARVALITPSAGLLGVSLAQLYREICDWLRSQGVEPASPMGKPVFVGNGGERSVSSPVTRTLVTLDKLRRLLSGELENHVTDGDFMHTVPASYMALEDLKLIEPMMRRLAERAGRSAHKGEASSAPAESHPEPLPQGERVQGKQLGKQLGQEVVHMMLDNLMQDKRLLFKLRVLIQRLEPVLLALAQSDGRFFSDRQHPARQFLDQITNRSLGFAKETDEGFQPFLKSVDDAATVLNAGPADANAFIEALGELERGWRRDEAAQRLQHEEAARALLHAEQRNLLAQRLSEDFAQRVKERDVPDLVVSFLRGPWAQVVAESQLGCADGSADPGGYLALVDELIWSVQYRLAVRNLARLVQMVPKLLVKLRQGLQLIQYPEERIPVFFDALISVHEKAIELNRMQLAARKADQACEPTAQDEMELPESGHDAAVHEELAESFEEELDPHELMDISDTDGFWVAHDEARESGFLEEDGRTAQSAEAGPWSAMDLQTGVWVELIVAGQWLRAQLTWASPHRTLFMFISHGGLAHSMSRRTMERLRKQGSIRVVSDGHVLDNALDAVVSTALQNDLGQVARQP